MRPLPAMIIFIALVSLACAGSSTPVPTATVQESAWTACTLFVEQQVGISYLDAQEYNPAGVTDLGSDRYQVEVFFAEQNQTYRCELLRRSDGNWQLEGLEAR